MRGGEGQGGGREGTGRRKGKEGALEGDRVGVRDGGPGEAERQGRSQAASLLRLSRRCDFLVRAARPVVMWSGACARLDRRFPPPEEAVLPGGLVRLEDLHHLVVLVPCRLQREAVCRDDVLVVRRPTARQAHVGADGLTARVALRHERAAEDRLGSGGHAARCTATVRVRDRRAIVRRQRVSRHEEVLVQIGTVDCGEGGTEARAVCSGRRRRRRGAAVLAEALRAPEVRARSAAVLHAAERGELRCQPQCIIVSVPAELADGAEGASVDHAVAPEDVLDLLVFLARPDLEKGVGTLLAERGQP